MTMKLTPDDTNTIFLALAGSQAHGTSHKGSDVDLRGICVAPLEIRLSLFHKFEQYEGAIPPRLYDETTTALKQHPTASSCIDTKVEVVIFDIAKFMALCAATNPNALEILFTDPRDWIIASQTWEKLYRHRHRFLTQRVQATFCGYAVAQLKKIKSHRSWLLNPPGKKPTREEFGLPSRSTIGHDDRIRIEQGIAEHVRTAEEEDAEKRHQRKDEEGNSAVRDQAIEEIGLTDEVVSTLKKEKRYRAALKHWQSYQSWEKNRNPARAKLEHRFGYDTKHATHLVRLLRMGREVLASNNLIIRRPDAEELIAIRNGALTFDQLLQTVDVLQKEIDVLSDQCTLPNDVDCDFVDRLLFELISDQH